MFPHTAMALLAPTDDDPGALLETVPDEETPAVLLLPAMLLEPEACELLRGRLLLLPPTELLLRPPLLLLTEPLLLVAGLLVPATELLVVAVLLLLGALEPPLPLEPIPLEFPVLLPLEGREVPLLTTMVLEPTLPDEPPTLDPVAPLELPPTETAPLLLVEPPPLEEEPVSCESVRPVHAARTVTTPNARTRTRRRNAMFDPRERGRTSKGGPGPPHHPDG